MTFLVMLKSPAGRHINLEIVVSGVLVTVVKSYEKPRYSWFILNTRNAIFILQFFH